MTYAVALESYVSFAGSTVFQPAPPTPIRGDADTHAPGAITSTRRADQMVAASSVP